MAWNRVFKFRHCSTCVKAWCQTHIVPLLALTTAASDACNGGTSGCAPAGHQSTLLLHCKRPSPACDIIAATQAPFTHMRHHRCNASALHPHVTSPLQRKRPSPT
jgi:hypothetical protein